MILRFKINTQDPAVRILQEVRKITGDSYALIKRNIINGDDIYDCDTRYDDDAAKNIRLFCYNPILKNCLSIYRESGPTWDNNADMDQKLYKSSVHEALRKLDLWEEISKEQDEIADYEALEEEYTRAGKKYTHDENCKPVLIEDTGNDSDDDNS